MNSPDDTEALDKRPVEAHHFFRGVIAQQDGAIEAARRRGTTIPDGVLARMRRVEGILLVGNSGGRRNPTINLPTPYTLADVEAVVGAPDDDGTAGSDAVWRHIRRLYDAKNSNGGLTR
jgi:hypothetical protein